MKMLDKEKINYFFRNTCIFNLLRKIKSFFKYIFISYRYNKKKLKKINIIGNKDTINKIVENKMSLSRFGDGEIKWILNINQNSFQDYSEEMAIKLKNILKSGSNDKVLVGILGTLNSLEELNYEAKFYWKKFTVDYIDKIYPLLANTFYSDSSITRPYIDYKNKSQKYFQDKFYSLKKIWENRNVIFVEGEYTKLGQNNDLFDNCKSIKRIICPATNAFEKYNDIANEIRKCGKEYLFLISLGPTATILTYELGMEGYQCIDTGHIDIEYMWFINKAKKKEPVLGKFVNESKQQYIHENDTKEYKSQIIAKII